MAKSLGLFSLLMCLILVGQAAAQASDPASRGALLAQVGSCLLCHTDPDHPDQGPAGGRALTTAFGTFYTSNITPDPGTGLGRWSLTDFKRAMRQGKSPAGQAYWPAFPYPAFSGMADSDLDALFQYLRGLPPVVRPATPHRLKGVYNIPGIPKMWRALLHRPKEAPASPPTPTVELGRYWAEAVGHCGECHTPRTAWGTLALSRRWSGAPYGDTGKRAPDIRQNETTGIGGWSDAEMLDFFDSGSDPEGSPTAGVMAEIVEKGTHFLPQTEKEALIRYMRTVH